MSHSKNSIHRNTDLEFTYQLRPIIFLPLNDILVLSMSTVAAFISATSVLGSELLVVFRLEKNSVFK
jgi:hypothetical protein